jgi:hypothetical protein
VSREERRKPSDIERLNALMRSVYGRTFDQFLYETLQRGYKLGFQDGYKQGIKGGRRLAKGKAEFPKNVFKPHGRPPVLDPFWPSGSSTP